MPSSSASTGKKSWGAKLTSWLPHDSSSSKHAHSHASASVAYPYPSSSSHASLRPVASSSRLVRPSTSSGASASMAAQKPAGPRQAPLRPVTANAAEAEQEYQAKQSILAGMKAQTSKLVGRLRKKLNSKTPVDQLPQTWAEYSKQYQRGSIDLNDPPLPPLRTSSLRNAEGQPVNPTPFEAMFWPAPLPLNEAERQNVVNRLDLFGTRAAAAQAQASASQATLSITLSQASAANSDFSPPPSPSEIHSDHSGARSPRDSLLRRDSLTSTTPSTAATVADETAMTMENHPVFRNIVAKCRELFNVRVGLMTVLDDEQQLFLATGGLPDGVESMPRSVSFCSHAILNDATDALVVPNSQLDWRFANNVPSAHLGARFYCGVPLLAPTFGDPNAPAIAIGTLCVLDDKPRDDGVTEEELVTLRALAAEASKEVETWVNERMATKLTKLESNFQRSHIATPAASALPAPVAMAAPGLGPAMERVPSGASSKRSFARAPAGLDTPPETPAIQQHPYARKPSLPAPDAALPATPPGPVRMAGSHSTQSAHSTHSAHLRQTSDASSVTSSSFMASTPAAPRAPKSLLGLAVTTEDPVPAISRETQKVFDTATRTLLKALDLSLVYLVALDLAAPDKPALRVLSACNLPSPVPAFDPVLHLKALRAPEGGLLYKNARYDGNEGAGYAAGMLIPIMEVRRVGYVLSGYTKDVGRDFGQKDLTLFVRFAEQLEQFVVGLGRN